MRMTRGDRPACAARRPWHRLAVAAFAVLAPAGVAAQFVSIPFGGPHRERPSPNADLRGAPADVAAALGAPGRSAAMRTLDDAYRPVEMLAFLGLARGEHVLVAERDTGYLGAIIGTGIGPDGRVTELVPPEVMSDPALRAALADDISRAPNLSLLTAETATARLAAGRFDLVVLHRVLGRLSSAVGPAERHADFVALVQRLFIAVRPGGIVGVIDAASSADGDASAGDATAIGREFADAGFVLDSSGRVRGRNGDDAPGFILRFRKPE